MIRSAPSQLNYLRSILVQWLGLEMVPRSSSRLKKSHLVPEAFEKHTKRKAMPQDLSTALGL